MVWKSGGGSMMFLPIFWGYLGVVNFFGGRVNLLLSLISFVKILKEGSTFDPLPHPLWNFLNDVLVYFYLFQSQTKIIFSMKSQYFSNLFPNNIWYHPALASNKITWLLFWSDLCLTFQSMFVKQTSNGWLIWRNT